MSRSFVFALALFGMVAVLPLPAANAQALSNYDGMYELIIILIN